MESTIGGLFAIIELALEVLACAAVVVGAMGALWSLGQGLLSPDERAWRRRAWLRFAAWIVLGLEFALAADIVRSLHSPSWNDLGQLAVVAVLRTLLSVFVWRDLGEVEHVPNAPDSPRGPQ